MTSGFRESREASREKQEQNLRKTRNLFQNRLDASPNPTRVFKLLQGIQNISNPWEKQVRLTYVGLQNMSKNNKPVPESSIARRWDAWPNPWGKPPRGRRRRRCGGRCPPAKSGEGRARLKRKTTSVFWRNMNRPHPKNINLRFLMINVDKISFQNRNGYFN